MEPPNPDGWVTYRMADGTEIFGEYAWVTDPEFFEDGDEPIEVIKETWKLIGSETVTFKPSWWTDDDEDDDRPTEDAGTPDHLPE